RGLNASSRFQFRMDSPEAEAQRQFDSILLTSQPAQGSVHREAGLSREYLAKGPSGNKVCILARAPGGQMRGAATQATPVCIVEERQQSRSPPAAAPLRAAARRPAAKCTPYFLTGPKLAKLKSAGGTVLVDCAYHPMRTTASRCARSGCFSWQRGRRAALHIRIPPCPTNNKPSRGGGPAASESRRPADGLQHPGGTAPGPQHRLRDRGRRYWRAPRHSPECRWRQ